MKSIIVFGLIVFFINGCAKKIPPLLEIQNAKIALAKAKEADAAKLSPDSFESAKKHFKEIKSYMDREKFEDAKYLAQKAMIEAKLSQSKAQNAKIQKEVDKLGGEVNIIKKEFTVISE